MTEMVFIGCIFMYKKITSLKAQKKNRERINVYLDHEFAFGLSRIVAAWLKVGQELNPEQIDSLLEKDTYEKAYQKALLVLNYRSRSEHEMRQKLHKAGFHEAVVEEIIKRLKSNYLLGDEQFAQNWVENRATFRPRSHRMLTSELRQKGIENHIIEKVLEKAPSDLDLANLLLRKKLHKYQALDWQLFRKKAGDYLLRRGFPYSVVRAVVQTIWSEKEAVPEVSNYLDLEEKEK